MNRSFRKAQKYKNRLTDPILPKFKMNFDPRNGIGVKRNMRYVKATEIEFVTPRSKSTTKQEKFFFLVENSNSSIYKKPDSNSFLSETRKKDFKIAKKLDLRIILPNMPNSYFNY